MMKLAKYKFTFLVALIILVALLVPSSTFRRIPIKFSGIDKVVHFALFFAFALAYLLEYKADHGLAPTLVRALLPIVSLIILSETLQLFTRSRHFELADMGADFIGAIVSYIIVLIVAF
jgi:VanZ family protein